MLDLQKAFVAASDSIREVMQTIDRSGYEIALVVDERRRFLATVTDGDLRRAILAGANLDLPVTVALTGQDGKLRRSITALAGTPRDEQLRILRKAGIRHLPLLDRQNRVVELVAADDSEQADRLPVQAVIMAGGFGKRLRPLTDNVPKPMLHVGGRPLMERTIQNLKRAGIERINVTTHYLPEKIRDHFGDGSDFGVELTYISEDQPLGTAGALSLVSDSDDPILVMNGDILTSIDFRSMLDFHRELHADLTVAVRQYDVQVPYGVIQAENGIARGLKEKPKFQFLVNAGIYVLQPTVRNRIASGRRCDMTDLIESLLDDGRIVATFPVIEYWLDIGQQEDFQRAQEDVQTLRRAA